MVHSCFVHDLMQMIQYCNSIGLKTQLHMLTGSLISRQRQHLAQEALENNATHVLWVDSDMMFPPTALETLICHQKTIVGCNYSTRSLPLRGVAYRKVGNWESWLGREKDCENTLVEVEASGMGFMLVDAQVFCDLPKPWFEIIYSDEYQDHIGEDFYFCLKAAKSSHVTWIDTKLSQTIKHLGTSMFDLSRIQNSQD
jgi:choline kinase